MDMENHKEYQIESISNTKQEQEYQIESISNTKQEQEYGIITVDTNKEPPCDGLCLNIGSGKDYKQGHVNIDKYDNLADANWDIEHLPLNDRCAAQIVCADVLEHMSHHHVLPVLKELFRILKLEGRLIIIVPDIISLCEQIIKEPDDEWKLAQLYGNQTHEGQFHRTAFTVKRLQNILGFAGFNSIISAYYMTKDGLKSIYCEAYKK